MLDSTFVHSSVYILFKYVKVNNKYFKITLILIHRIIKGMQLLLNMFLLLVS